MRFLVRVVRDFNRVHPRPQARGNVAQLVTEEFCIEEFCMKSSAWVFDPPIWMKIGESGGTIERARKGEGRAYSGLVEAVEEFGLGCVL